ncbi:hypothetical protein ACLB2K_038286 [Fragaria x ananassa]
MRLAKSISPREVHFASGSSVHLAKSISPREVYSLVRLTTGERSPIIFGDNSRNLGNLPISAAQQTSKVWSRASTLKLNVDGAYLEHRQDGDVGGILRNSTGNFIAAYTSQVMHINSDLHVELLAIREGIDLIQKMQLQQVVIETDCLQAVNELYSSAPNMSSLALAVYLMTFKLQ